MKKYQVIMTGVCSLVLVFGLTLIACENDTEGGGFGGLTDQIKGRGDGNSNEIPPAPASIVASVASSSSITVSWSPVSGASGYKLYRENTMLTETNEVSYEDKEVSPGTLYRYTVSAYNNKGDSPPSSPASVAIITNGNIQAPSAPTGVTATRISPDEVYVTWTPVSGATSYRVYFAYEKNGYYGLEGTADKPSYSSYKWESYDYGYFKVTAVNGAGESPKSDPPAEFGPYSSEGSKGSAPSTPYNVTASATSSSSITLSWTEVSGASGYMIYRSRDNQSDSFFFHGNVTASPYIDTGLLPGTTYYYTILAYNEYGESSQSSSTSATTLEGTLSAPEGVHASATSSSSITVYWTEVYGATGYKVYRSEGDSYYSLITSVSVSSTSYTDTGLSSDSTYYYKVSTVNSAGQETPQSSSTTSAKTWSASGSSGSALPAPTSVWAYKLSSDEVSVYWSSVSGAKKYVIYWKCPPDFPYYSYEAEVDAPYTSYISEDWAGYEYAYFKITAVNEEGVESEQSAEAVVYLGGSSYSVGNLPPAQKKLATQQMR